MIASNLVGDSVTTPNMWGSPKHYRASICHLGAQLLRNLDAITGAAEPQSALAIDAVVTICAQQKRHKPHPDATAVALQLAPLAVLATQWRAIVKALPTVAVAADLYGGRAFGLARTAAIHSSSRLYVISAGLGLVDGQTPSPTYGLTVAPNASESIQAKAEGAFAAACWFDEMLAGPLSTAWDSIFQQGRGEVLVALTRPYAEMAGPSLARLPPADLDRLRIFGAGLTAALPASLHGAVVPYDDRLDALFPGTRSDFAQRAMVHYVENIARKGLKRDRTAQLVSAALAEARAPERIVRRGVNDIDLLALIKSRLAPRTSASRLLRQLRDDDGIACEQGRFARLFREAQACEARQ